MLHRVSPPYVGQRSLPIHRGQFAGTIKSFAQENDQNINKCKAYSEGDSPSFTQFGKTYLHKNANHRTPPAPRGRRWCRSGSPARSRCAQVSVLDPQVLGDLRNWSWRWAIRCLKVAIGFLRFISTRVSLVICMQSVSHIAAHKYATNHSREFEKISISEAEVMLNCLTWKTHSEED